MEFNIEQVEYKSNNKKPKNKRLTIAIICFIIAIVCFATSTAIIPRCNTLKDTIADENKKIYAKQRKVDFLNEIAERMDEEISVYIDLMYEIENNFDDFTEYDDYEKLYDIPNLIDQIKYYSNELKKGFHSTGIENAHSYYMFDERIESYEEMYNNCLKNLDSSVQYYISPAYYHQIDFSFKDSLLKIYSVQEEYHHQEFEVESDRDYVFRNYQKPLKTSTIIVTVGFIMGPVLTVIGLVVLLHKKKHNTTN